MIQIVAFEGLSPFLIGTPSYVKRGLLDKIPKILQSRVDVWRGSFMRSGPKPHVFANKIIVIGHSMGGPSAIWWCKQYPALTVDLMITLDPRPLHQPYTKPKNVLHAVNFYRGDHGMLDMQGYTVIGAKNNHCPDSSHPSLPFRKDVLELLLSTIGG